MFSKFGAFSLFHMVKGRYKVKVIQFIINSTMVSDRYWVSTDTQAQASVSGLKKSLYKTP